MNFNKLTLFLAKEGGTNQLITEAANKVTEIALYSVGAFAAIIAFALVAGIIYHAVMYSWSGADAGKKAEHLKSMRNIGLVFIVVLIVIGIMFGFAIDLTVKAGQELVKSAPNAG